MFSIGCSVDRAESVSHFDSLSGNGRIRVCRDFCSSLNIAGIVPYCSLAVRLLERFKSLSDIAEFLQCLSIIAHLRRQLVERTDKPVYTFVVGVSFFVIAKPRFMDSTPAVVTKLVAVIAVAFFINCLIDCYVCDAAGRISTPAIISKR